MMLRKSQTKSKVTPKSETKRIMIFGTFDMVHKGHSNFFKQARALAQNPFLIVSIARDSNVLKIKGRRPRHTQQQRRKAVGLSPEVDKVVIGAAGDHMPHIIKEKPDIIALGYDQVAYVRGLKTSLKKAGLPTKVVRLKSHKPHLYKTSLLRSKQAKS